MLELYFMFTYFAADTSSMTQETAACNASTAPTVDPRTEDSSGPGKGAHGVGIGLKMGVTVTSARDGTNGSVMIAIAPTNKIQGRNTGRNTALAYFFTDFATGTVNIYINALCVSRRHRQIPEWIGMPRTSTVGGTASPPEIPMDWIGPKHLLY